MNGKTHAFSSTITYVLWSSYEGLAFVKTKEIKKYSERYFVYLISEFCFNLLQIEENPIFVMQY